MLEHGGNLALATAQYGIPLENWLDLSTGINPDGYPIPIIPPSAWQRLPIENDGLIEAALAYYGCQHALATAGSQAALQVLPQLRAHSKIAMPQLMYQEHGKAWQRYGHEVIRFEAYPDTQLINSADVVLLCNPNNPTATLFSATELLSLHAQLASRGGWLIVDEAFMDVTPEHSIAQHAHLDGLFVLRSLGKFFGLAGARVGFLIGAEQALIKAQEAIGPWSITGPSRVVAKQALTDKAWQQHTRSQLPASSQKLANMLTQYGLAPTAGTALFQFVYTPQAEAWQQHFARQGILLRLFSECSALRFGLPTEDGWVRLGNALKTFNIG
ncbi:MAG: threonine-phosphate decarboxylase CobD [Pseudomonadota bacterium]